MFMFTRKKSSIPLASKVGQRRSSIATAKSSTHGSDNITQIEEGLTAVPSDDYLDSVAEPHNPSCTKKRKIIASVTLLAIVIIVGVVCGVVLGSRDQSTMQSDADQLSTVAKNPPSLDDGSNDQDVSPESSSNDGMVASWTFHTPDQASEPFVDSSEDGASDEFSPQESSDVPITLPDSFAQPQDATLSPATSNEDGDEYPFSVSSHSGDDTPDPTRLPTPKPSAYPTGVPTGPIAVVSDILDDIISGEAEDNAEGILEDSSGETSLPVVTPEEDNTSAPEADLSLEEPLVYDAVIVGSGWSGLRAAQLLSEAGASVLVLEANDYIGGRSKTDVDTIPGVPTDLGSEWLYTSYSSQGATLLKSGLIDASAESDMETYNFEDVHYYSQTIDEDGVVQTELLPKGEGDELRVWNEFVGFMEGMKGDASWADALEQFLEENDLTTPHHQFIKMMLESAETEFGGDANMLSVSELSWYFTEEGFEETYYLPVPGAGFGNTIVSFASSIKADFKLNSKVFSIDYSDDDFVNISYEEDGTTKEVKARTALVTVSLGVLKAGTITFTPELPEAKQEAIDGLGFGLLNKAVLYWDSDDAIVWPDTYWLELSTADDANSGVWTTWMNASKLKSVPTLIGWIGGDEAWAMEEQTDEQVLDQIMVNLRSMFPSIASPDKVVITRWGKEQNVLGSYSYNKAGRSFVDDAKNIKESLDNRVWFAGEATQLEEWHATTVGAWSTGEDAAKEMESALKERR